MSRAAGRHRFPCRFQLVLAANPCPCGFGYGKGVRCRLLVDRLSQYQNGSRGRFLDRVDIQVFVPAPSKAALLGAVGQSSAEVAARVAAARRRQGGPVGRDDVAAERARAGAAARAAAGCGCLPAPRRSTPRSTGAC